MVERLHLTTHPCRCLMSLLEEEPANKVLWLFQFPQEQPQNAVQSNMSQHGRGSNKKLESRALFIYHGKDHLVLSRGTSGVQHGKS